VSAGRERAALFTWERTAAQTVGAYRDLLDESGSDAARVRE